MNVAEEQLDVQTLHRVRDRLVGERTALINQLRAVLLERGIDYLSGSPEAGGAPCGAVGAGQRSFLSLRIRRLIDDMRAEWHELDRRIAAFDDEFSALARSDADARRLATIPGIGVMNATASLAAIGNGQTFARGRDRRGVVALVPRQVTTGGKPRLVGITKRGKYLRKLLIHGARAVGHRFANKCHAFGGGRVG